MLEKIRKIIKNRSQILEGLKNTILKKEDVEKVAELRMDICKTNACGYYDPEGRSEKAVMPGSPCCGACGCSLALKTRCMSCKCGITDLGKEPLWDSMSMEGEDND